MTSRRLYTLVLIRDADNILLGKKKRGFGEGKWNGFGGKVEKEESILDAAVREVQEECGLIVEKLVYIGILEFEFTDDPIILEVHVFTTSNFSGIVTESEEMLPKWFSSSTIPYETMWPDDKFWFPLFLKGTKFRGYFVYKDQETIEGHTLSVVEELCVQEVTKGRKV